MPTDRDVRFHTRFGYCDIGWGPYTIDARRESCDATCEGHSAMTSTEIAAATGVDCCVDFGTPFLTTGVAVAYMHGETANILEVFTSLTLINALCTLMALLVFAAHVLWVCEREHNSAVFPRDYYAGIGSSLWWSIVTVTTVGYGDKVPRTKMGRIVSAFFCVLIVTIFYPALTGILASELVRIQEPHTPTKLSDFTDLSICTTNVYASLLTVDSYTIVTHSGVEQCMSDLAAVRTRAHVRTTHICAQHSCRRSNNPKHARGVAGLTQNTVAYDSQGLVDGVLHDRLMLNYLIFNTHKDKRMGTTPALPQTQIQLSPVFPDDQNTNMTAADVAKHGKIKEHYNAEVRLGRVVRHAPFASALRGFITWTTGHEFM